MSVPSPKLRSGRNSSTARSWKAYNRTNTPNQLQLKQQSLSYSKNTLKTTREKHGDLSVKLLAMPGGPKLICL